MYNFIFKLLTYTFMSLTVVIHGQNTSIMSVTPEQDVIGASRTTQITIEVNHPIDSLDFNWDNLFHVYGSNSSLVDGITEVDSNNNKFIFTPQSPFFCGEIISTSFGPVIKKNDSVVISYNWRFTIEIANPTNANFDSLKRFDYPSTNSIAIDFDKDGDIDLVSGTYSIVIYNDGFGNFTSYEQIDELTDLGYLVDLNNDNNLDIITSGLEYELKVYLGTDSGDFLPSQILYPYDNLAGITLAKGDINGDGFIDLIAEEADDDYYWRIFINDGTGIFIRDSVATNAVSFLPEGDLLDMDKDGDLDLVFINSWSIDPDIDFEGAYIYYNDGTGNFTDSLKFRFQVCPDGFILNDLSQLFIIDYDLNGLNDIASFGSVEGGLIILQEFNNSFCGFEGTGFSGPENFAFFTSGDLNGNNRFDMITSNQQICIECGDSGDVRMHLYKNYDPINFGNDSSHSSFSLGLRKEVGGTVVPLLADVDNDGDLDVIHTGYPTTITYNQEVVTDINDPRKLPFSFSLAQNYPNPFNSLTNILYAIPSSGYVKLTVFDVLGRQIEVLLNKFTNSGEHIIKFDATHLSSGIYFYMIEYDSKSIIKKMAYLK